MYCECKSVHYCAKEFQISLNRPLEQVAGKHMRVPGVDFQDGRNTLFLQFEVIFDAPGRARIGVVNAHLDHDRIPDLLNEIEQDLNAFFCASLNYSYLIKSRYSDMISAHRQHTSARVRLSKDS